MTEDQALDLLIKQDEIIYKLNDILSIISNNEFYIGLFIGLIVALIFWNVIKGMKNND